MKEFSEFLEDYQRLICEAMALHNDSVLNLLNGTFVDNNDAFEKRIQSMSDDAKSYLIETLKSSLPEEYR